MENSWPWGDKQKTIYKYFYSRKKNFIFQLIVPFLRRSNCHLVPSSTGLIQERIKKLNYCEKFILRPKTDIHRID